MPDAWVIEKMQACLHLADIYGEVSRGSVMQLRALQDAVNIAPWRREPLLAMARFQRLRGNLDVSLDFVNRALSIPHTMRPQDYLSDAGAWDDEAIRKEWDIG